MTLSGSLTGSFATHTLKKTRSNMRDDIMEEAYKTLAKPDEFDAIGSTVGCKLRRMNEN
jgi:hypothetical protein